MAWITRGSTGVVIQVDGLVRERHGGKMGLKAAQGWMGALKRCSKPARRVAVMAD